MLKQTNKVEVDEKDLEDGEIREPTAADVPYSGRELLRSQVRLIMIMTVIMTMTMTMIVFLLSCLSDSRI